MTPRHDHHSHRRSDRRSRRIALAAVAWTSLAAGALAACGDDEPDDATPASAADTPATSDRSDTTTGASTGAPAGDLDGVCDDYATITGGLLGGQADPATAGEVLDRFAANAPDEISDAASTVRDGLTALFTAGDDEVFGDPAFIEALGAAGDHLFEACEHAASVNVRASDYAFDGLPASVPAGRLAIRFVNVSTNAEPHEMLLLRRPEGDTATIGELAQLPMDELMSSHQMAGVVFADQPGIPNVAFLDLEPGSYLAICTIPVTGDEATTHAMAGMVTGLEVTA